jgi:Sigma-70, region 4
VITKGVTFEKKPVGRQAYKALERVIMHTEAMRRAEADRKHHANLRATSINSARAHGMSLETIAEALGVSRERVRQMAARETD